ncbi:MAG: ABC transporter ATP-binding protein [Lachnospiraceae bacterium]|nr:ABC transporter ATP-binding protein [Lachnospiraceae bacterium]
MIQVVEITQEFGQGKKQKTALKRVSWTVLNGSVTGLIGRKGSGKTAAIRIITGIQEPSHGKVLLDGNDIAQDPMEARRAFGYVPDTTDQFLGLTGEEYLSFIADIYEVEEDDRRHCLSTYAKELKVDLELKHRMSGYSKGVYKKVMLLGAMIYQPRNLILDEFFDGLSASEVDSVKQVLKEYAQGGRAVLVADKKLQTVDRLCDQVVVLVEGESKYTGSLTGLFDKYGDAASLDMIDLMINKDTDKWFSSDETQGSDSAD